MCATPHAGRRAGLWTVIPCQLIVMVGLDIVYCVTAGKSMQFLYKHTCHGWRQGTCAPFGLSAWIVVFAAIQMILSMVTLLPVVSGVPQSAPCPSPPTTLSALLSLYKGVLALTLALHFFWLSTSLAHLETVLTLCCACSYACQCLCSPIIEVDLLPNRPQLTWRLSSFSIRPQNKA